MVCRGLAPTCRFPRGYAGGENVFAVVEGRCSEQPAVGAAHRHAVTRIGPRLLAADVEFHGAIDWRCRQIRGGLRWLIHRERRWMYRRRVLKPHRVQIFENPFASPLPSITPFAIPPKTTSSIE